MVISCAEDAATLVESRIAEKLGPQRFNVWFKNATRLAFTADYLRVSSPNHFIGDWIERHFASVIAEAAREITGQEFTLSFEIDPILAKGLAKKQPDKQVDFVANNPERLARQAKRLGAPPPPVLRGRMDDFVVGVSNRLAHAAAMSVIEQPSTCYNPLFVHGGCGIGKTHLLQGICNGIREKHPHMHIRYVTGEEFTNDYVYAMKAREHDAFRQRYRTLDVLVIDDVHFFANKRSTQEEFLHTFKAIDMLGKQVALSSDAHPKMIGHFSDQLVSRFLAGMVVRIDSPDLDVRRGVLRQQAEKLRVDIPDIVIEHVAENFRSNIRELEGALLKIIALAQVNNEPITLSLADRGIRDLVRQNAPVIMLSDIETIVAIYFGLTPADLHTSRKSRTIALARGIAMYMARRYTDMSYPEIGRFMGNKNHSTVILACRRISKMLQANEVARWMSPQGQKEQNLAELIQDLEDQFGRKPSA
jgi:chromosomal replication initiator protein